MLKTRLLKHLPCQIIFFSVIVGSLPIELSVRGNIPPKNDLHKTIQKEHEPIQEELSEKTKKIIKESTQKALQQEVTKTIQRIIPEANTWEIYTITKPMRQEIKKTIQSAIEKIMADASKENTDKVLQDARDEVRKKISEKYILTAMHNIKSNYLAALKRYSKIIRALWKDEKRKLGMEIFIGIHTLGLGFLAMGIVEGIAKIQGKKYFFTIEYDKRFISSKAEGTSLIVTLNKFSDALKKKGKTFFTREDKRIINSFQNLVTKPKIRIDQVLKNFKKKLDDARVLETKAFPKALQSKIDHYIKLRWEIKQLKTAKKHLPWLKKIISLKKANIDIKLFLKKIKLKIEKISLKKKHMLERAQQAYNKYEKKALDLAAEQVALIHEIKQK